MAVVDGQAPDAALRPARLRSVACAVWAVSQPDTAHVPYYERPDLFDPVLRDVLSHFEQLAPVRPAHG